MNTHAKPVQSNIRAPGKTAQDKASGALDRRFQNHKARASWDGQVQAKDKSGKRAFPLVADDGRAICNGKRSQGLMRTHRCGTRAVPGKKGGGPCRHRKGKKA